MSKKCPNCNIYNPDSAITCDCGYSFQKEKIENDKTLKTKLKFTENYNIMKKNIWDNHRTLIFAILILVIINISYLYFKNNQFYNYNHKAINKLEIVNSKLETKLYFIPDVLNISDDSSNTPPLILVEIGNKNYDVSNIKKDNKYLENLHLSNLLLPYSK